MRLLPRLEDKQKFCVSCRTYSVRVPKAVGIIALSVSACKHSNFGLELFEKLKFPSYWVTLEHNTGVPGFILGGFASFIASPHLIPYRQKYLK